MTNNTIARMIQPMFGTSRVRSVAVAQPIAREPQCELRKAIIVGEQKSSNRIPMLVAAVALATATLIGGLIAIF